MIMQRSDFGLAPLYNTLFTSKLTHGGMLTRSTDGKACELITSPDTFPMFFLEDPMVSKHTASLN
jgi:hypothetical protein